MSSIFVFCLIFYGYTQDTEEYIAEKVDSITSTIKECDSFIVYKDFSSLSKGESRLIQRKIRRALRSRDDEYCFFMYTVTESEIQLYKKDIEKKWWRRKLYISVEEVYEQISIGNGD